MRRLIVGTAGHVDHGKTEIVKALTGRDTDRLSEEKARGISIVLGFAPLDLGGGISAGVVDVPGHERFVKNMVSGAVGVDLALVVVAADEGIMPQTEEHLEVLRLLGVKRGVVVITKTDLVDEELVELVESEIGDLAGGTFLEGAPIVRTSTVTGEGLDELREALRKQAEAVGERENGDFFRMPVDRIFTLSGIGTIVTGTVWSGEAAKGDTLVVEPGGRKVRVREVHSFERALDKADSGIRAALALHGVRVDEVGVGDQVLSLGVLEPSLMLNAAVEVGRLPGSKIRNRQRVRFHHAAGEIMCRVIIIDRDELTAGERGYVQLRLEKRTVAMRGDRFVLRSYSPMRVIGGGRVLDPTASKAKRFKKGVTAEMRVLDLGSGKEAAAALAERAGTRGVSSGELKRYGLTAGSALETLAELEAQGSIARVGERWVAAGIVSARESEIIAAAEEFASRNRLLWGIDREELKEKTGMVDTPLFDYLLERGKGEGKLFFKGGRVRVGSGERALSEEDRRILAELEGMLRDTGFAFLRKADLNSVVGDERRLTSYLHILQEDGSIVRIPPDGFLHGRFKKELIERFRNRLLDGGELSVGDFKAAFGLSRKYAVPLLEFLDGEGYTRRDGDVRRAGPRLDAEESMDP